jgi:GNAT superfamily N-acetyltransferase
MSDVKVREIAPGDYKQWLPLWNGYNEFYGRVGPTALPAGITKATWSRFFDENEPVHALVAEQDGRIIGIVHYLFHRSTTLLNDICYLQDLFTDETARVKGIGRALIEAVCAKAKAAGSTRVYWQTHESNAVAQVLYNKVSTRSGFVVYRREL